MCGGKTLGRVLALGPSGRGCVFHPPLKQPVITHQRVCPLPWPASQHRSPVTAMTELWRPGGAVCSRCQHTVTLLRC